MVAGSPEIFNEDRDVLDADSELFRQRIQRLFCNLDEIFALHPSPLTQTAHPHRIASVILFIVVTHIVREVSFLFLIVLFLVWLFPKKDIASRRAIRTVWVEHCGRILLMSTWYSVPVGKSGGF